MQLLGKYEIIAEIGRGAMGAVYKARDPLIDRLVALKTITGGPSAQSNLLDRFYQEARSAGALQHPNIVTIYELGHEKNTPFIAMEYLEGESLDRIIEQKLVLPLSVKLGYIVRVIDALAYAHQHNVVHRDVKPANIMVTKEGVVKVVDFGIARLTDMSMTQPNMMIGSRAYMSPQLYKGERADARSDIWAVGVSLYELLAYRRPFTGESEAELMFHIIYEKPEDLLSLSPECTEELVPIVNKMLEKKSEDRFQTMEDVMHALEPIWKTAQQATVSGLLADCKELVVAKDLQRAQALLRKALHIDVGNSQAKSMLEKVSVELRRSEIQPRLEEHLSRGEGFLKAGKLREAKSEAEAALGLDSKHEPAHKLIGEVEAAAAKVQQLEQKLKLTKQRLAEGALTEAAAALGQALELDDANPQAKELKKQIEEERLRREKRKKLSEILHRARTLWTELNYDECLSVLADAMQEFPNEPELKKLQDSAKTDQAEQQKLRQMAEVRRLLGQQNFSEAKKVLAVLAKEHPQDIAVKNLQNLGQQEEQEQNRQKKLESEITILRGLLGAGKYKQVVAKGESLLQEFPQEYELKELVNYAQGEVAQQEQKRKEEEREKQIQGFLMCERYGEALDTARKAIAEFPKQDAFRKLATEAEALKKEQDDRERARLEMQRRVREINSKIGQDKITDAIDLAQKTMETMGPDPNVTQLLQGAEEKKKKKEEQEQKVAVVQDLVNKGDHAGATQLFKEVMATQIFQPSDPRMVELSGKIASLASGQVPAATQLFSAKTPMAKSATPAKKDKAPAGKPAPPPTSGTQVSESAQNIPAVGYSATRIAGPSQSPTFAKKDGGVPKRPGSDGKDVSGGKTEIAGATMIAGPALQQSVSSANVPAAARPNVSRPSASSAAVTPARAKSGPGLSAQLMPILRKPAVLAGAGVVVVAILVLALWPRNSNGSAPSPGDLKLKQRAEELWQNRQFDQAEQIWQGLAGAKGPLQKEAAEQVSQIEQKRKDEQQKFDQAEALLKDQKDFAGAQQAFQDVIQMNLWHSADASRELEATNTGLSASDVHKQEQDHFDQGVTLYQAKDYEKARKEFRAVVDLNVADSTLKPQAESYLGKMRQTANDQKLFDTAMQDVKDENWSEARDQFQEVIKRKGPQANDAKKQLPNVEKALQTVGNVEDSIRSGSFRAAKTQLDSAQHWSRTHDKLLKDLHGAEQQQFEQIKSSAQSVESKGDAAGIQRVQDDIHRFEARAEDASVLAACKDLEKHLNAAYSAAAEKSSDKSAFDAAVAHFEQAKQRGDVNQLEHAVSQEFQKLASGPGIYREQAALYVKSTIPSTIQGLTKSAGKLVLPALSCGPGRGVPPVPSAAGAVSCAQLDANPPLEWVGIPMVDFPDEAKKPGKLPYSLTVMVTVEPNGNVKVDKEGNADKEFFKKVKDASKHWKTTAPRSGGKSVSVRFPLTITFQR
ncbi:MAG TPA: protein kinase [Candidatus Solibacter sp.]|nr:protein kinase [Candidatus Solibacter sp.]